MLKCQSGNFSSMTRFAVGVLSALLLLLPLAVQAEPGGYTIHADDQLQVIVYGAQGVPPVPNQAQPQTAAIPRSPRR